MKPFTPESLDALKAKLKKAIAVSQSVEKIMNKEIPRPGENSNDHLFDFENGIRLLISRGHYQGKDVIHFSGSLDPETYKGIETMEDIKKAMVDNFLSVAGYSTGAIHFMGLSEKGGIPHWKVPLTILN